MKLFGLIEVHIGTQRSSGGGMAKYGGEYIDKRGKQIRIWYDRNYKMYVVEFDNKQVMEYPCNMKKCFELREMRRVKV